MKNKTWNLPLLLLKGRLSRKRWKPFLIMQQKKVRLNKEVEKPSGSIKNKLHWVGISLTVLILIFLYFWSLGGGTTQVKFEIKDNSFTIFLDGKEITQENISSLETGGIGYRQYRQTVPYVPVLQSIRKIKVTDLDTGEILLEENFDSDSLDSNLWDRSLGNWEIKDHSLTAGKEEGTLFCFRDWKKYFL